MTNQIMDEFFKKFPHYYDMQVAWGDMDVMGHVNNARYLTYFESARVDYFRSLGYHTLDHQTAAGPILAYIACQYIRPVRFPDTLVVGTISREIGNSSIKIHHSIFSNEQKNIVATCESVVVIFDYRTGKKVRVPEAMRSRIQQKQQGVESYWLVDSQG